MVFHLGRRRNTAFCRSRADLRAQTQTDRQSTSKTVWNVRHERQPHWLGGRWSNSVCCCSGGGCQVRWELQLSWLLTGDEVMFCTLFLWFSFSSAVCLQRMPMTTKRRHASKAPSSQAKADPKNQSPRPETMLRGCSTCTMCSRTNPVARLGQNFEGHLRCVIRFSGATQGTNASLMLRRVATKIVAAKAPRSTPSRTRVTFVGISCPSRKFRG